MKNFKKVLFLCFTCLFVFSNILSCSSNSSNKNSKADTAYYGENNSLNLQNAADMVGEQYANTPMNIQGNLDIAKEVNSGAGQSSTESQKSEESYNKKVIKELRFTLKNDDILASYEKILAYLNTNEGYEFSRESNDNTYNEPYIYAVIKIKPENIEQFSKFLSLENKVLNSSISSQDITESYYDTETRLKNLRLTLEKYYEFLAETKTVKDMLLVQTEIDNLTWQIESAEGTIKMWNSLVKEATVYITLQQNSKIIVEDKKIDFKSLSFDDMKYLIRNGFIMVLNFFVTVFQWIIIGIVSFSLIFLVITVIIILLKKKMKNKKKTVEIIEIKKEPENQDKI